MPISQEIPYCTEPIRLPGTLAPSGAAIGDAVGVGSARDERWAGTPEPGRHAWYRWIGGHQTVFATWRLVTESLGAGSRRSPTDDDMRSATTLLQGSTALLVYTGSCTRDVYHDVLRPAMSLWHPSFSGRWSADYAPLPGLIHHATNGRDTAAAMRLRRTFARHRQVHYQVARRLVPDGVSLLQQSTPAGPVTVTPEHFALFDAFFAVSRSVVAPSAVLGALARRIVAISYDIRQHGLIARDDTLNLSAPEPESVLELSSTEVLTALNEVLEEAREILLRPERTASEAVSRGSAL